MKRHYRMRGGELIGVKIGGEGSIPLRLRNVGNEDIEVMIKVESYPGWIDVIDEVFGPLVIRKGRWRVEEGNGKTLGFHH